MTLWGNIKKNFDVGDIITVKSLKVGNYNDKSLNISEECRIKTNYTGREHAILTKWYKENKKLIPRLRSLTGKQTSFNPRENAILIAELLNKVSIDTCLLYTSPSPRD